MPAGESESEPSPPSFHSTHHAWGRHARRNDLTSQIQWDRWHLWMEPPVSRVRSTVDSSDRCQDRFYPSKRIDPNRPTTVGVARAHTPCWRVFSPFPLDQQALSRQTPRQPKHTRLASTDPASIDSPFSKAPPTHPPTHPPTDLRGPFKRLPIFKQLKCRRHIFSCERARTPPSALAIFRLLSFGQALGGRHRDGGWNDRGRCCSASPQYNSFYPLRSMGSANPD